MASIDETPDSSGRFAAGWSLAASCGLFDALGALDTLDALALLGSRTRPARRASARLSLCRLLFAMCFCNFSCVSNWRLHSMQHHCSPRIVTIGLSSRIASI
eukprot:1449744-Prymnesium_polylepis.1